MNKALPITSREQIEQIKLYLKYKNTRDYMLFYTGINTGFRISDLLSLKVSDIKNNIYIYIKEGKTKKGKIMLLNKSLKKTLDKYIISKKYNDYLFESKRRKHSITRQSAHVIFKDIEEKFNLNHFSCHSLRKTFAYFHYLKFNDLAVLMAELNHSSELQTLNYIGLTQDRMDNYRKNFHL
jgi:integrase